MGFTVTTKPPSTAPTTALNSGKELACLVVGWILTLYLWRGILLSGWPSRGPFIPKAKYRPSMSDEDWADQYYATTFYLCLVMYIIEALLAPAFRYLRCEPVTFSSVGALMSVLRKASPKLWHSIQCYHYEMRAKVGKRGRRTTKRTRINTHFAKGEFPVYQWQDESELNDKTLSTLSETSSAILRLRVATTYYFGNEEVRDNYEMEVQKFVKGHDTDDNKDVQNGMVLGNTAVEFKGRHLEQMLNRPYVMCCLDPKSTVEMGKGEYTLYWSKGLAFSWYLILSAVGLSVPYQTYFTFVATVPMDISVVKRIDQ